MTNRVIDELLKHAYDMANSSVLPDREKHYLVDRTLRTASDLYSCDMDTLTHSSMNVRRYCKYWSTEAFELYKEFRNQGMTHRQACNGKIDGKSAYINEHEIPLQIINLFSELFIFTKILVLSQISIILLCCSFSFCWVKLSSQFI